MIWEENSVNVDSGGYNSVIDSGGNNSVVDSGNKNSVIDSGRHDSVLDSNDPTFDIYSEQSSAMNNEQSLECSGNCTLAVMIIVMAVV